MAAPREHDDETRARAVRLYQDRLRDTGVEARRQAGALLDVRPAVLRNWVERERKGIGTPASTVGEGDAEVKALRRSSPRRARLPTQVIVACIDAHRHGLGAEPVCTVLSQHGCSIAPRTCYTYQARPVSPAVPTEAYPVNMLIDLVRRQPARPRSTRAVARPVPRRAPGRPAHACCRHHRRGFGWRTTRTTLTDRSVPRHQDLARRDWNAPTAPDRLWAADFTW